MRLAAYVRGLVPVRDEERAVWLFLVAFLTLMVLADWIGKIGADSLFVKRFGVQYVPAMYIATPVVLLGTSALIFAIVDRVSRRALLFGYVAAVAVGSLALQLAMPWGGPVLPLAYVFTHGVKETIYLLFWIYAGSLYDSEQSQRLFPLFAGAVLLGKILGGLVASALAEPLHAENFIGAQAIGFGVCLILVLAFWRRLPEPTRPPLERRGRPRGLRASLASSRVVARDELMRWAGAGIFLWYLLMQIGNYLYLVGLDTSSMASAGQRSEDLFSQLYASVYTTSTLAALGVQFLFTREFARRLGAAKTLFVLPFWYLLSYTGAFLAFNLVTAVAIQLGERVVVPAVHRPISELIFGQVSAEVRGRARAFLSGGVNAVANVAAALLLMAAAALGASASLVLAFASACSFLFVLQAWSLRRALGRKLAANLASEDEALRRNGLQMFAAEVDAVPTPALRSLLVSGEPEVRRAADAALARRRAMLAAESVGE